jgi:hypothetical protein
MLAIPPCGMLAVLVWQVLLGHQFGKQQMTNTSVVGWTIFLWIIYFRLITVSIITEVRDRQLIVTLRGLWRARRVPVSQISSVEMVTYDPEKDYGGYGIRSNRDGTAYLANGKHGVRIRLANGSSLVVGSQRAGDLAAVLRRLMEHPATA